MISMEKIAFIIQGVIQIGLTAWVYKVLNTIIKELRVKVADLEKEVSSLKDSENNWFRRYQKLLFIINTFGCKNKECGVKNALNKYLSEEGETV